MLTPSRSLVRRVLATLDPWGMVFVVLIVALHIAIYVATTGSPFDDSPSAWDGWWDQSQYVRSARALAARNLSPDEHWYSFGYALLGAPFVELIPKDPFFIVNTISLVVFALAFVAYFAPILGRPASMACFLVSQLLPASVYVPHNVNVPVWMQYVFPWNTIPTAALLMMVLLLVQRLRAGDNLWRDAVLGVVTSMVIAIRPSDALPLLVPAAFYFHQRVLVERAVQNVSAAVIASAVVLGPYAALSLVVYGGLSTPYHSAVRDIGASTSDLHERAYAILIDARTTHGELALATLQPWLIAVIPLAIAWAAMDVRRGLLAVGAVAVSLVSYISFNDFWPYALLKQFLIHYVVWTLPVLTGAGVAAAVVISRTQRWSLAALTLVATVVLVAWRLVPVSLPAKIAVLPQSNAHTRYELRFTQRSEVDAIDFVHAVTRDMRGVTTKHFAVYADGQPLEVYSGFRPLQTRIGLRIVFNRHVAASHLVVVLDNTISNQPATSADVRALRFEFQVWPRN